QMGSRCLDRLRVHGGRSHRLCIRTHRRNNDSLRRLRHSRQSHRLSHHAGCQTATSTQPLPRRSTLMKILIIGAGVLGLTAAFNLVNDGHEVTIVDKTGPYAQASSRSFAWVNANHKLPAEYYELNRAGITAHENFQRLHADRGTWFHQRGCIMWDSSSDREKGCEERANEAAELGYPVERVDGQRLNT